MNFLFHFWTFVFGCIFVKSYITASHCDWWRTYTRCSVHVVLQSSYIAFGWPLLFLFFIPTEVFVSLGYINTASDGDGCAVPNSRLSVHIRALLQSSYLIFGWPVFVFHSHFWNCFFLFLGYKYSCSRPVVVIETMSEVFSSRYAFVVTLFGSSFIPTLICKLLLYVCVRFFMLFLLGYWPLFYQ